MSEIKKHYGIIKSTGSRCIVVFRELPLDDGLIDKDHCLIINADSLPAVYADAVAHFVKSKTAQASNNLYEAMHSSGSMPTGEGMLTALHNRKMLRRWDSDDILMQVTPSYNIPLKELNEQIKQIEGGQQEEIKANDFNPFAHLDNHVEDEQKEGIAYNLLQEARDLQRVADEKLSRAYQLNPELQAEPDSEAPVIDSEKTSDKKVFTVEIEGITQTEAIKRLKEAFKDNKKKSKDS